MSKKQELGKKGESIAADYLRKKGYQIRAMNWRHTPAEVDIIAEYQGVIVFVEVKTRSTNSKTFGYPEDAVTDAKERLLAMAAEAYLAEHNLDVEMRFDIIAIVLTPYQTHIRHIEDAFFFYDE